MEVKLWSVTSADHFFCLRACGSGSRILSFEAYVGNGNNLLDLYPRRSPVCGAGLCEVQRYDRRTVCNCLV